MVDIEVVPVEVATTCHRCNQSAVVLYGPHRYPQCENHYAQLLSARAGGSGAPGSSGRIVCAHCGVRGKVRAKKIKAKRGVSGGKATGAVLTGGLSLLATGLSRKEKVTQLHCSNCGVTWVV